MYLYIVSLVIFHAKYASVFEELNHNIAWYTIKYIYKSTYEHNFRMENGKGWLSHVFHIFIREKCHPPNNICSYYKQFFLCALWKAMLSCGCYRELYRTYFKNTQRNKVLIPNFPAYPTISATHRFVSCHCWVVRCRTITIPSKPPYPKPPPTITVMFAMTQKIYRKNRPSCWYMYVFCVFYYAVLAYCVYACVSYR